MRSSQVDPRQAFLEFIRAGARQARARTPVPATAEAWDRRLGEVRAGLLRSMGRMPETDAPLEPEVLGVLKRDGYAIERLTFQSRPGVRVTANLYRPDPLDGPRPAVLNVHGHWPWARIDPHVQARAIGLARLGYVALCVDAFGAGERAIEPAPGTYHGASTGAMLWPAGVPLIGLQVYDNRRAVDYLISRPEVDPERLAITGASGGGNQSLYAGALDDRLKAVVPVCGIGTYDAYLGAACCVCEALPGGMTYASTGEVLALMAPRALLVINASRDALQFSPGEAAKSLTVARERYRLLGLEDKVKQVVVESGHDYNQPMREAMYGWLDRWLRGKGDGSPVPEPALTLEDPADLRCYPDAASRPSAIVTIPQFALAEGRARLAEQPALPDHPQRLEADVLRMRSELQTRVLGAFPPRNDLEPAAWSDPDRPFGPGERGWEIGPEPGLRLRGVLRPEAPGTERLGTALLLRAEGIAPADDPTAGRLRAAGWAVLTVDLRATGRGKPETAPIHGIADHTEAEWALWIGRPLLGQWAFDARRWLDALERPPVGKPGGASGPTAIVGVGPMALVALVAAGLDERPSHVELIDGPVSLVGDRPFAGVLMGLLAPGLLAVGDVGHLAMLTAPRRLIVAGGIEPHGAPVDADRLRRAYAPALAAYEAAGAPDRLTLG